MSGPECCSNPPTLNPNSGLGHVDKLAGFNAYVTGSTDSKLAVLLASDIFGYEAPNLRKLADKIAAAGFFVAVPNFFNDDPFDPEGSPSLMPVWLQDHGVEKGFEDAKEIVEALKSKGFTAIGAAGFCWGAKVVVDLAKIERIDAAVLLHAALVTVDDIKEVKVPISVLGAETDNTCPPELARQFEEILNRKPEIESFVKIFPGVAHGWTTRYDVGDKEACKSASEAHADLLDWFTKYVKCRNKPIV